MCFDLSARSQFRTKSMVADFFPSRRRQSRLWLISETAWLLYANRASNSFFSMSSLMYNWIVILLSRWFINSAMPALLVPMAIFIHWLSDALLGLNSLEGLSFIYSMNESQNSYLNRSVSVLSSNDFCELADRADFDESLGFAITLKIGAGELLPILISLISTP